ncbi:MAG: pseudouridine synthase [Bacteroidales bacterium]
MNDSSNYRPRTGSLNRKKKLDNKPHSSNFEPKSHEESSSRNTGERKSIAPKKRESFFKNRTPHETREMRNTETSRFNKKHEDGNSRPERKFSRDKDYSRPTRNNKFSVDENARPARRFNADDASRPRKYNFQEKEQGARFDSPRRENFGTGVRTHARPYDRKSLVKTNRREFPSTPDKKARKKIFVQKHDPTLPIRLNKFISNSGLCSRREADEYIQRGEITVNGEVVTTLGHKVMQSDEIRYNGDKLSGERKMYILLNKPKGYVTTVEDEHATKTVMELIAGACKERVYPVGRLDKNTTGVLLFTNDGDLTKILTHPSYNKRKVYQVGLDKNIPKSDMEKLVEGIELEDGIAIADEVGYADISDKSVVGIEIHSGRNRIVRRMFEALGYEVKKLDRVYFAGLTKKSLERGRWRFLSVKEVNILKMGAYE